MAAKVDVLRELDSAWGELMRAVESVPEDDCETPGVVEQWSLKDLLGHIAFWSERAAETLRCATAGKLDEVPMGSGENWVDKWNADAHEARKGLSFHEVRAEWMRNHKDAAEALDHAPEEALGLDLKGSPIVQYFTGDTSEHYREHIEHIKTWQQQLDTSEA